MAEEVKNSASRVEDSSDSRVHSKKDKKKKKKDKKRKHEVVDEGDGEAVADVEEKAETPSSKKDKKRKKKAMTMEEVAQESDDEDVKVDKTGMADNDDKEGRRETKKQERLARKREKEELMAKVPKVDEDGISYTKLQIKRMLKRVKRGLPPVPTKEEEHERLRNEAQLRREEEAELAGMIFRREDDVGDNEDDDQDGDRATGKDDSDDRDDDDDDESEGEQDEEDAQPEVESSNGGEGTSTNEAQQPPKKKSKRSKPVPQDYVCSACKNKHSPIHWIYDCPDKVTVRGTNNKKKKERGLNQPDSRKVFVSGLPFDVKPADVQQLFQGCGKVASCKLVKFGDTGRCNGQAYVSFDTDEAATKSLKLSGTAIDNSKEEGSKKKSKKSDASPSKRRELKLKISRVLNRRVTKKTSRSS